MSANKIKCKCGSVNVIRKGFRKIKLEKVQRYLCKDCGRYFTLRELAKKTYPATVIMDAISNYNRGYDLDKCSRLVNERYKVKVSKAIISYWLAEFRNVCTYHRIRGSVIKNFKPEKVLFTRVFYHKQPYKFSYHKAKVSMFINEYFSNLRKYLDEIAVRCPDELFMSGYRCSEIKFDCDFEKSRKWNYACKIASLALKAVRDNKKRHERLQEFMLINDTSTVACEIPVYITAGEIDGFELFKLCGINGAVTGHIDLLQMRFGRVWVLDFKPEAVKEKHAWCQVFVYTLALSLRTGIWLRNFRCAYFDDKAYYEFNPNDIFLAIENVSPYELRKYVTDEGKDGYYTSRWYAAKRQRQMLREKISGGRMEQSKRGKD